VTEQQGDPDVREDAEAPDDGIQTGSAPQPLDFPGADSEPPGRPDGDSNPDEADSGPDRPRR
jgi:hypothetical protein